MKKISLALSGLGALLLMAGCSTTTTKALPYQGESAEYIYAKGHEQVKDGDYYKAIDSFRSLNSQYPFQSYTEMGNLELIYSYYQDGQPEMALGLARQFLRAYPTSKHLGYVYYMMGVINYDNGRGFLQRRLPYDMAQHDPASYLQAFNDLKRSVILSPKASYAEDARRRMVHINNVVAEYEYNIANFYFEHEAYVAAINRAKIVVEKYPQSNSIENALVLLIRSYDILKMPELAEKSMEVLKANYPNNAYLKSLEDAAKRPTVVFK
ncbi:MULTISPECIES: outer membrane protein assembly factor BamD [Cysteiniphilum]|uniref:outer membrane protein assembly factor BamD n=1 Tax=Cysteiniphilum TaxID=2056696 RepID=UPI00177C7CCF|nr:MULTISPECIES: outer membrane protein assembly factor BamD [Cysteiniphilum]